MRLESIFFLLFWRWWRMSVQEKYDYLFDKNANPTWQAWSICLVFLAWGFAGWALWANYEAIWIFWVLVWDFGYAEVVLALFLTFIFIIYSEFLRVFSWYFGGGITLGHFLGTEFLELKGFKYFGLLFLTNLGQAGLILYILKSSLAIPILPQWGVLALLIFTVFPLIATGGLLVTRKYLQNRLHDLLKISQPADLLDVHLLDNDSTN
jgi:hypothetical protein